MEDYETIFDEFWKELVENPDGSLNIDQVKRELHDYSKMLDEVPKVYCHVTGGLISKANTDSEFVIMEADAVITKLIDEGVEDEIKPYKIEIEELGKALVFTQKHLDAAKEEIRDLTISMKELDLSQKADFENIREQAIRDVFTWIKKYHKVINGQSVIIINKKCVDLKDAVEFCMENLD